VVQVQITLTKDIPLTNITLDMATKEVLTKDLETKAQALTKAMEVVQEALVGLITNVLQIKEVLIKAMEVVQVLTKEVLTKAMEAVQVLTKEVLIKVTEVIMGLTKEVPTKAMEVVHAPTKEVLTKGVLIKVMGVAQALTKGPIKTKDHQTNKVNSLPLLQVLPSLNGVNLAEDKYLQMPLEVEKKQMAVLYTLHVGD
jgi:hypothetical protein